MNNEYLFEPMNVCSIKTQFQEFSFLGMNKLEFAATHIAAGLLSKYSEFNDVEFVQQGIAKTAVDIAKELLQRCNDEKIVAAQLPPKQSPLTSV